MWNSTQISTSALSETFQDCRTAARMRSFRLSLQDRIAKETDHHRDVIAAPLAHLSRQNMVEATHGHSGTFKPCRRLKHEWAAQLDRA